MSSEPDLSAIQTDQTIEDDLPEDFLTAAVQTNQILNAPTIPGPDNQSWKTYWSKTNPEAWSLVWDSFVTNKQSLYQYYQSGASVPYTFNIASCIDSTAKGWGLTAMTSAQQQNAQKALADLGGVTGLQFSQSNSVASGLVISMCDLGSSTYGQHFFDTASDGKVQYTIVLNSEFFGPNPKNPKAAVDPLNPGYVTLLHEFAHAAGLDDAEGSGSDHLITVNPNKATTEYTVMAYTGSAINTTYADLDKQALSIIYRKTETKPALMLATLPVKDQIELAVNLDDNTNFSIDDEGVATNTQPAAPGGDNQAVTEEGAAENSGESGSARIAATPGTAASGVNPLAPADAVSLLAGWPFGANAYPVSQQNAMQQEPRPALFAQG